MQSAFVIEAEAAEGINLARAWAKDTLGIEGLNHPDIIVLEHSLLSVANARAVALHASGAPFRGPHKVVIVSALRAYHEAQNALLKIFEEPPQGVYLFFILPNLGELLPTLRSRVQVMNGKGTSVSVSYERAEAFARTTLTERKSIVKKLTTGKDEEGRATAREETLALVNGIEALVYQKIMKNSGGETFQKEAGFLVELGTLREYLHERSAPVRLVLEHLALVLPKDLV